MTRRGGLVDEDRVEAQNAASHTAVEEVAFLAQRVHDEVEEIARLLPRIAETKPL